MNLIKGSLLPALVASIACVVVGGLVEGGDGIVAALLATVVVAVFFTTTPMTLGSMGKSSPQLFMGVAIALFFAKMVILLAVVAALLNSAGIARHLNESVFGFSIMALAMTWTLAMLYASTKSRQPLFDLDTNDE